MIQTVNINFYNMCLILIFANLLSCSPNSTLFFLPQYKKNDFFWNQALHVMTFHRNKMNEYLCKNYVASEIIENLKNQSRPTVQEEIGKINKTKKSSRLARESLLADPGSQKYKDWLSRSSTLEDIYRQFDNSENDHTPHYEIKNEHEGEVTGYAVLGHKHVYQKPVEYVEEFYPHGYQKEEEEEEHHEKGLKLKELFHFALTAIAFLAFACFMIEIIMCLMEIPQNTEPDYVLVPTTTGTGHASKLDADADAEVTKTMRQGREINLDPLSLDVLNSMTGRVLSSIEALTKTVADDSQCFQRVLCQNTKYSMTLKGSRKIWLPFWSFGVSWIAQRVSKRSTIEYLKAIVMGLGKKNCEVLYPSCNAKKTKKRKDGN